MDPQRIRIALASAAGSHPENEDAVAIDGWQVAGDAEPFTLELDAAQPHVIVLADGLGGHRGGHVASALVARRVSRSDPYPAALGAATLDAHQQLGNLSGVDPAVPQPGSTALAVGWIPAGEVTIMTIGDTLAFRIVEGALGRVASPQRTARGLLQCVGGGMVAPPKPEFRAFTGRVGRLILCTDGVWETVAPDALERLGARGTPRFAASALLDAASAAHDDATVVVLDLPEPS